MNETRLAFLDACYAADALVHAQAAGRPMTSDERLVCDLCVVAIGRALTNPDPIGDAALLAQIAELQAEGEKLRAANLRQAQGIKRAIARLGKLLEKKVDDQ